MAYVKLNFYQNGNTYAILICTHPTRNFVHYIFHDNYTPEIIFNDGNIHSIVPFNQLRKNILDLTS